MYQNGLIRFPRRTVTLVLGVWGCQPFECVFGGGPRPMGLWTNPSTGMFCGSMVLLGPGGRGGGGTRRALCPARPPGEQPLHDGASTAPLHHRPRTAPGTDPSALWHGPNPTPSVYF